MGFRYIATAIIIFIISTSIKLYFSHLHGEKLEVHSIFRLDIKIGNADSIGSIIQIYAIILFLEGLFLNIIIKYTQFISINIVLVFIDFFPFILIFLIVKFLLSKQ